MAGASKKRAQEQKDAALAKARSETPRQGSGAPQLESPTSGSRSSPPSSGGRAGFDGGDTTPSARKTDEVTPVTKNVDMSVSAWAAVNLSEDQQKSLRNYDTPARPQKFNNQGTEVSIGLNAFAVTGVPTAPVYQYTVRMTPVNADPNMDLKPILISKIWQSKAVQAALKEVGPGWLFDGKNLAWCMFDKDNIKVEVDLDKEREPDRETSGKNAFHLMIIRTKKVRYDVLYSFLDGKTGWNNECLEAFTMLDHLMREGPRNQLVQVKRSFFAKQAVKTPFGAGVDAVKGVYASLRLHWNGPGKGHGISVNADVANGTFWEDMTFMQAMMYATRSRNPQDLARSFSQVTSDKEWRKSALKEQLKRLNRVKVTTFHRDAKGEQFTVDKVLAEDPKRHTFVVNKGKPDEKNVSLDQYWRQTYQQNATPGFGVVQMTKKIRGKAVVLPQDVLRISQYQRYAFKLDDRQTSEMIKFAVTVPNVRWTAIRDGVNMLHWDTDQYLQNYGLKISPNRTEVKGRLLPTPDVTFANGSIKGTMAGTGRWRIDGKKFRTPNKQPLKSWGVCVVGAGGRGAPDQAATMSFFKQFVNIYQGHGGRFANPHPVISPGSLSKAGEMITELWNAVGQKNNCRPEILFFVLPDKNTQVYRRIKKACEIRYGIVSQCLQARHVMANQAQYISNVCMKVNAKLGGSTCAAISSTMQKIAPKHAKTPTMIIGADVSHPAPGGAETMGSMCAITMSTNQELTRFCAYVQTNGHRVEIITEDNIRAMEKYFRWWMTNVGGGRLPERVVFLRDGLSQGQYSQCLLQEVDGFKRVFKSIDPSNKTGFTVLIASKRHHVRFFPNGNSGDRNGNAKPGTLVESGVTAPFEFDFYLCAHSAIKGTARPVHYYTLLNESGMLPEEIQQMVYDNSYQYCRATTPISQPPAVYYAHLASNRAMCHINEEEVSSGKKGDVQKKSTVSSSSDNTAAHVVPLAAMNTSNFLQVAMWYV